MFLSAHFSDPSCGGVGGGAGSVVAGVATAAGPGAGLGEPYLDWKVLRFVGATYPRNSVTHFIEGRKILSQTPSGPRMCLKQW